jgi:hypothetical protein
LGCQISFIAEDDIIYGHNLFLTGAHIEILAHDLGNISVIFEQKNIKLLNKWLFVENKTQIWQHVLKMQ